MSEFLGYIGMGIAVFALAAPLAYCEMRTHEADIELQKACIEAKGDWTKGWGKPFCKLHSQPSKEKADELP